MIGAEEISKEKDLKESLQKIFFELWDLYLIFWTLHWTSSGLNFYSDHLMAERIYKKFPNEIDSVAEYMVALFGVSSVDIATTSRHVFESLREVSNENLLHVALEREVEFIDLLEDCIHLANSMKNVAGLSNLLSGLAQSHQGENLYLLQQRASSKKKLRVLKFSANEGCGTGSAKECESILCRSLGFVVA